jgi:hypothetical protein
MIKSGISHTLSFLVSLIVGNAVLVLLRVYLPAGHMFFLRFGQAVALVFKITYRQELMASFVIATILSFFIGALFYKLFKLS